MDSTQKKAFNVILIVSVYRKDENFYPKVFLEKYNSKFLYCRFFWLFLWKYSNKENSNEEN